MENENCRMGVNTRESNLLTAVRQLALARAAYRHAAAVTGREDYRLAAGEDIEHWRRRVRGCLEDLTPGL